MPLLLACRPRLRSCLAALLTLPLALVAGACFVAIGDGDLEVDERALAGFDAVVNASPLDVEVTLGEGEAVRVVCDGNLLDRVETVVEDGVLLIDRAGLYPLHPRAGCRVEVDAGHLRALRNTGSGAVHTVGAATELSDIRQQGSGSITVDELTVAHADVRSTGSGSVHLAGTIGDVALVNTGSGTIHARDLQAETAQARSTGSGGLELYASELVDAELTGSGDIHVWGSPADRHTRTTGSGRVVFH
ncbi:Putative auto-transporter adhesin, head GIN domain [Nannocystis exedens]|uniref:Putative auto-transporter adhesin, head GIN domain n=1 Tax=Nannocystis exedens TaxID=54 RepID=A0A1I1YV35_9BACT|nr:head GIN domain-containing protein [Nannocystis exedens]PCC70120.1 hypothetical protein NAEX_03153 [Nannocystis exedens]SFE23311.1 Putative auto-transporter adhesin, head GIN domain [Nannocystis exedens]